MAHLIRIGNSLGVRIPKAILTQFGFQEDSELEFQATNKGLLISPARTARKGWKEAFETARKGKKEALLMGEEITNLFDKDEWKW